ncbi:MAG TPA: HlyC/CorC family transporter [Candidatus Copromonas avistercoris]|nr:HlyC/CorC family transporter [Candidatus Copromonas avistercoris]
MDSGEVLQIGIVIGLLVLSALFSLAETAMADVSKIRIRGLAEAGDKQAQMLMKVFERHGKMINTILICDTAANLAAAILMTLLVTTHFGRQYVWAGAVPAAFLVLILGEIAPKTAAALYAEKLSLALAKPVYGLMVLFTPVLFLVEKLSNLVLLLFRINPKKKPEAITEEDLRTIVEVGHEEGVIESDEKKMIYNVFDFGDSVAKDIMVPRTDMACIDAEATYEEFMEVVREQMYTRYPVYEETTDHVIGIINIKDVLLAERRQEFCIRDYLREPYYTYEYMKTADLMVELRKTQNNIAIVLDEYGATAGLITLEDMLEEIVGEIRDEYDEDEEDFIRRLGPSEYVVEASMHLDDLNDLLGLSLESEDYDSIGGFMIGMLDHLPEQGEEVTFQNLRLVADQVDGNRIDKVHIYLTEEPKEQPEEKMAKN